MLDFWILWINSRNLQYIKKFNPRKAINLADNKYKTKEFLAERWIPVPKTYWVIRDRDQAYKFNFSILPDKNFVIKPNKWSKWQWILVLEYVWENPQFNFLENIFADRSKNHRYKLWKEIIEDSYLRRFLIDIIDGKYSLTNWKDKILIEEKLIPGWWFRDFCKFWLADIRVIVFNLIPVAAMVRVPTYTSWWKANLAQWWVWLWVEVWSWKITSISIDKRIYTLKFPEEFQEYYHKKIPFWNDILSYSTKIQYFVNLWYLALDWVITDDWPKLLEINARAGLEVQNVSWIYLKNRLKKIWDIDVYDPDKWVEIAKSLFSKEKTNFVDSHKILYLSQYWKLFIKNGTEEIIDIIVEVDLERDNNYIPEFLYDKIPQGCIINLEISDSDIYFKDIDVRWTETINEVKIILGKSLLDDYYVKPVHKIWYATNILRPERVIDTEKEWLLLLDQNIWKLSRKIALAPTLRPLNYLDELDKFIMYNWKYNPKFKYNWPEDKKIISLEEDLLKLKDDVTKFGSDIVNLFDEKLDELMIRLNLINAYKKNELWLVLYYNELLFWRFDEDVLKISIEKINDKDNLNVDLWEKISIVDVQKKVQRYLYDKGIENVEIITTSNSVSRMSVLFWKEIKVLISKEANFYEKELLSVLSHEIDTHLVRYLNWVKTWWNIFQTWSWFYLKCEEWLAIYNALKVLPEGYEKINLYKKYFLLSQSHNKSFSEITDQVRQLYPDKRLEFAFKFWIRLKKWVEDTSIWEGWVYLKDKIYLEWYYKILDFVKNWWKLENLYKGKLKIEDLDFIN